MKSIFYALALVNAIESFHSIKSEWLNRFKIRDYKQAYRLIFEYLEAFKTLSFEGSETL